MNLMPKGQRRPARQDGVPFATVAHTTIRYASKGPGTKGPNDLTKNRLLTRSGAGIDLPSILGSTTPVISEPTDYILPDLTPIISESIDDTQL